MRDFIEVKVKVPETSPHSPTSAKKINKKQCLIPEKMAKISATFEDLKRVERVGAHHILLNSSVWPWKNTEIDSRLLQTAKY